MERKPSVRVLKTVFAAMFLLAGFLCRDLFCFAQSSAPAGNSDLIEAVVIHVDQYAVYAPNLVFYFDTRMDKRKIETLKRTADRLRNKKALITYFSSKETSNDKRMLLMDIASPADKPTVDRPGDVEMQRGADTETKEETKAPLTEIAPAEPKAQLKQSALQEPKRTRQTGQSDPITREEIRAFVRRLLYLNGRKDLSAVAPFYADNVDYYDRGVINRDKVLQDLKYYFRNWAEIDTRMDGDIAMTGFEPDVRIVKFISSFSVRNEKKSIYGKTENVWTIQRINGELRLIDVKQKILEREPSVGSPR